jgi:acetylcholinesterase
MWPHGRSTSQVQVTMLLALALASVLQTSLVNAIGSLSIGTTSGQVIGVVDNSTTPHVAQFLSIPFAEQPIGARRWLPPSPKSRQNATIDATRFGHACPQYETDVNIAPNLYNVDIPEFAITPFGNQGEDCLSLSIWAPWQKKQCGRNSTELLPVVAWFYGGGWAEGGAQVPYQNPGRWVERSGKHIVVSVK